MPEAGEARRARCRGGRVSSYSRRWPPPDIRCVRVCGVARRLQRIVQRPQRGRPHKSRMFRTSRAEPRTHGRRNARTKRSHCVAHAPPAACRATARHHHPQRAAADGGQPDAENPFLHTLAPRLACHRETCSGKRQGPLEAMRPLAAPTEKLSMHARRRRGSAPLEWLAPNSSFLLPLACPEDPRPPTRRPLKRKTD